MESLREVEQPLAKRLSGPPIAGGVAFRRMRTWRATAFGHREFAQQGHLRVEIRSSHLDCTKVRFRASNLTWQMSGLGRQLPPMSPNTSHSAVTATRPPRHPRPRQWTNRCSQRQSRRQPLRPASCRPGLRLLASCPASSAVGPLEPDGRRPAAANSSVARRRVTPVAATPGAPPAASSPRRSARSPRRPRRAATRSPPARAAARAASSRCRRSSRGGAGTCRGWR